MLRVIVLVGLLLVALPALAAESSTANRLERLAAAMEEFDERLTEVRGALDQTRFDPDELLFELAFDAAEVVEFVSSAVAFQPYDGLLRGIRGTLQSRSGNSLDQSVLLAYLLKSAGFEARVVRGSLDRDGVTRLLAATAAGDTRADFSAAARVAEAQFGGALDQATEPVDMAATATAARARQAVSMLTATLAGGGLAPGRRQLDPALLDSARHYFWVQWRYGAGSEWQDVHPAFPDIPAAPEVQEYFADEVPARYHHTVTFSVHLRRRMGSEFETVQLMEPWTRPAANLHGVALSFHNQPAGLPADRGYELLTEPRSNRILIPMFNGAAAPGAIGFDLRGRPVDAMVAGQGDRGAAGLFAELGERFDQAAGSVADPDDPGSAFGLDALWLEWTLTAPDGSRRSQRRYLHGPLGGGRSAPLPSVLGLLTEHTYVVNTGSLAADYLADRYLETAMASTGMFQALARRLLEAGHEELPGQALPESFSAYGLFALMDRNPLTAADVVAVRGEPAIVGVRSGLRDEQTAFVGVDVVFNRMRHVADGGRRQDTGAALQRGVWETALEWLPNRLRDPQEARRLDVFEVFTAAAAQDVPLRVLGPSSGVPDAVSADAAERLLLERDLAAGYLAVVPARRPDGLARTGWWRVDPESGAALGMTGDGYGAETLEYVTQLVNIPLTFIGVIGAVTSMAECESSTDELEKMCCLVEKHLDNVGGLGFGGVLGASFGGPAAATYGVVDLGLQVGTGMVMDQPVSITPDVVNLGCRRLIEDKSWL